jgi:hypothetical protein
VVFKQRRKKGESNAFSLFLAFLKKMPGTGEYFPPNAGDEHCNPDQNPLYF